MALRRTSFVLHTITADFAFGVGAAQGDAINSYHWVGGASPFLSMGGETTPVRRLYQYVFLL